MLEPLSLFAYNYYRAQTNAVLPQVEKKGLQYRLEEYLLKSMADKSSYSSSTTSGLVQSRLATRLLARP
jgi:hypothetical protein